LKRFAPKYYGATLVDKKEKRFALVLENLLACHSARPSYLDLKMGTDCVLKKPGTPEYVEFAVIDASTTTREHGYRVTGYCLCRDNRVVDHVIEGDYNHTRTRDQVKDIFARVL